MIAEFCNFWNCSYDYVMSISRDDFMKRSASMQKVMARKRLNLIQAASFAHYKREDQQSIQKQLTKNGMTMEQLKEKVVSTDQLSSVFGGSIEQYLKDKDGR